MNLDDALRQFDIVEANLAKLEAVWTRMRSLVPTGVAFVGSSPEGREHRQLQRDFEHLLSGLPPIDGWAITAVPDALDDIGQMRFDARDIGEPDAMLSVERQVEEPGEQIDEYRARMTRRRRQLVRARLEELVSVTDAVLVELGARLPLPDGQSSLKGATWERLEGFVAEIDRLVGSGGRNPPWIDLYRHLRFAEESDLIDIRDRDWPAVKREIAQRAFDRTEPIPVAVSDLGALVAAAPSGRASTALNWAAVDADGFERLLFDLIADAKGYENPQWLMRTTAPDRGRDLSVVRVRHDSLSGVRRDRVIIQCKHWLTKSVADKDVAEVVTKMSHWEPPAVDVLIVATSGRFTADAVKWVEQRNHLRTPPHVEMWPESHLEHLLAQRPHLVATFKLR